MDFMSIVHGRRSIRKFKPDVPARDVLAKIAEAGQEAPSGCNVQSKQFIIVDDPDVMEKVRSFSRALDTAPAMIVTVIEPVETKFGEFWVQDAAAAMENMLLAAVSQGLGSCWVEGAIRRCEDELREILQVPDKYRIWNLTPIGIPDESPQRPPKPTPAEVTHYNAFGGD